MGSNLGASTRWYLQRLLGSYSEITHAPTMEGKNRRAHKACRLGQDLLHLHQGCNLLYFRLEEKPCPHD